MIWEPFVLALILGLVVSGGLYFAYLWPSVEPLDDGEVLVAAGAAPVDEEDEDDEEPTGAAEEAVPESKADADPAEDDVKKARAEGEPEKNAS